MGAQSGAARGLDCVRCLVWQRRVIFLASIQRSCANRVGFAGVYSSQVSAPLATPGMMTSWRPINDARYFPIAAAKSFVTRSSRLASCADITQ